MVSKNDITGDKIKSKISNENYRKNYEKIFKKSENINSKSETSKTMSITKLPAGKYIIGDPCYIMTYGDWSNFIKDHNYFSPKNDPENQYIFNQDGIPFSVIETTYGDGEYKGNDGNFYPVDSGLLAAIPENFPLINEFNLKESLETKSVALHNFTQDFECAKINGVIKFGYVEIYDSFVEEEQDWDYEEELQRYNEDENYYNDDNEDHYLR